MLPWQKAVKGVSKKPVLGVGRFTSPDLMVEAINDGALDIIATCRPSISDPFLPKKIDEGRLDDIRECIGCNICISRWEIGGPPVICTQNATAGEEYRRGWHPEKFEQAANADNDVLVVGAGPAGMECARVLGERGMRRVHLVEAQDDMGGIMRWIPQLPGLGEWGRVVNYRKIQIDKLKNVEFIPNTRLDADGVNEYGAEIVVVATGWLLGDRRPQRLHPRHDPGRRRLAGVVRDPRADHGRGQEPWASKVLIVDNDGYFTGVSLAEKLAEEGKQVTLMTPLGHIAPYMHFTLEAPNMHRKLHKLEASRSSRTRSRRRSTEGKVTSAHVYDEEHLTEWGVDSVVLVTQRRSNEALYRELKDSRRHRRARVRGRHAASTGSATASPRGSWPTAVFDGHRLAREIDSDESRRCRCRSSASAT